MESGGAGLQQLVFFLLLLVGLYFIAIRPQRVRAKAMAEVRAGLAVGTRVMTAGGMHGTVAQLEGDTVVLELAPGVPVRFATAAVVRILDPAADEGQRGTSASDGSTG